MAEEVPNEFRPTNDSRERKPVSAQKENPIKSEESKPTFGQKWRNLQPTKAHLVWTFLIAVILTMIVGFNWGGWVSGTSSLKAGEAMAQTAVIDRLAPICVAQYDLDPDKAAKLVELNKQTTSYQRSQFVRDQGWATISGMEKPDPKVADACAKLIIQ